ncbi:hypothetical protein P154DRAFT_259094 [Amniculicola lignicola CBS 123094]|uniref:Zn(2)-C6 fungal-type domain-containing protein n=1 Tax=Amniculicola lignicola CBS 123094 TaxID=1392246 RepID=A0A6A5WXL3_9PLEO|nr:hypothetical protein P154DRAFT_259094 [Amniculicola lignicola CBS 123094]
MPPNVGPYDGRKAKRKRCEACVRRKIKCHGGIPCSTCVRTNRACKPPLKPTSSLVFVGQTERFHTTAPFAPNLLWSSKHDRNLAFFFMSFLPINMLANGRLHVDTALQLLAKSSPALVDAIQALSILHRRQHDQLATSTTRANAICKTTEALEAYGRSVRSVQKQLASSQFQGDTATLWTTFLLGLFELMRDATGENWLSHFLHGTCTMLRLQDVSSLTTSSKHPTHPQTFFLATRIFEIARALIYTEPTFLSDPKWTSALCKLWGNDTTRCSLWHPKEALFDMLPQVSHLGIQTAHFRETLSQQDFEFDPKCLLMQSLAEQGHHLRHLLHQWRTETVIWEQSHSAQSPNSTSSLQPVPDPDLLTAHLYYHAASIYLSGLFDYDSYWQTPSAPHAPILPRSTIVLHVAEILRLSRELLALGVSGVLLFFPLRVAGARAVDGRSRDCVLELLGDTERRGFVVAGSFRGDLLEVWGR